MKIPRRIGLVLVSLVLGDMLVRVVVNLSIDTPNLNRATQWLIAMFSSAGETNPDVVFDVGMAILILFSSLFAALLMYLSLRIVSARRQRPR